MAIILVFFWVRKKIFLPIRKIVPAKQEFKTISNKHFQSKLLLTMVDTSPKQLFWGVVVPPGGTTVLEPLDDNYTIMTGASLAEYDSAEKSKTAILTGTVRTTIIDKIDPTQEFDPESIAKTSFAYLTPDVVEYTQMNNVFSPLSTVTLENSGPHEIHVSGKYLPIDLEDEEEDEFEDSEEDLNDEELKAKILDKYIKKPKDEEKE